VPVQNIGLCFNSLKPLFTYPPVGKWSIVMSASVCIFLMTCFNFTKLSLLATCRHSWVFLWRCFCMLSTFSFADDVIFAHNHRNIGDAKRAFTWVNLADSSMDFTPRCILTLLTRSQHPQPSSLTSTGLGAESTVVWPTTSCFADWSKRRHVTLRIIDC